MGLDSAVSFQHSTYASSRAGGGLDMQLATGHRQGAEGAEPQPKRLRTERGAIQTQLQQQQQDQMEQYRHQQQQQEQQERLGVVVAGGTSGGDGSMTVGFDGEGNVTDQFGRADSGDGGGNGVDSGTGLDSGTTTGGVSTGSDGGDGGDIEEGYGQFEHDDERYHDGDVQSSHDQLGHHLPNDDGDAGHHASDHFDGDAVSSGVLMGAGEVAGGGGCGHGHGDHESVPGGSVGGGGGGVDDSVCDRGFVSDFGDDVGCDGDDVGGDGVGARGDSETHSTGDIRLDTGANGQGDGEDACGTTAVATMRHVGEGVDAGHATVGGLDELEGGLTTDENANESAVL